jgi:four helix bundle protein
MARIARFEAIGVWKKGRELRHAIYDCTRNGPFGKDFGLRDQIRRAAVSVTSNIAEGFERGGNKEFIQFLANSKGSCGELRDQLYAALDERYIATESAAHFLVNDFRIAVRRSLAPPGGERDRERGTEQGNLLSPALSSTRMWRRGRKTKSSNSGIRPSKDQLETHCGLVVEISRMISGLMRYLKQSEMCGAKFKTAEPEKL